MKKSPESNENEATSQKYITDAERKQLLSTLNARLFWVGQSIPDYMEFEGKRYPLRNYVWQMIKKDVLTPEDKSLINKYIDIISAKEKENEKKLEKMPLKVEEAKSLYHETAGLLRAIMDLKEIESGALKESTKRFQEQFTAQRVKDAKLWLEFIKKVSK
ncbi:MAG: DUF5788 family protein [Euryarchaeota archaeon]|nr:DUF5788 family protein [Euryarchaeota archaeon]